LCNRNVNNARAAARHELSKAHIELLEATNAPRLQMRITSGTPTSNVTSIESRLDTLPSDLEDSEEPVAWEDKINIPPGYFLDHLSDHEDIERELSDTSAEPGSDLESDGVGDSDLDLKLNDGVFV
jgi:hypothetical protein